MNWRNAALLTWDKRQLERLDLNSTEWLTYSYNSGGIRTKKYYVDTAEQVFYDHRYILDGSTILKETIERVTPDGSTTTTLYYYYDESGISGVSYNGTKYSYVRNLQGDVIAIINSNGVTVVEYTYDAWGNVLSVTGSLASTLGAVNPFRYRGYYYDTETGFYYLNSRYYDPQVGRFLNADSIVAGISDELSGYNLFAYCFCNPVNMSDTEGHWPKWITGVLNIVSGASQMVTAAAVGIATGWTGVGAVAASVLAVNGAATIAQGVGQVVNDATDDCVLREDNVVRTGTVYIGDALGGDTGAMVAGSAYDATIISCSILSSYIAVPHNTVSTTPPNPGVPFKPGRTGMQYGVDPNTLTPTKNLSTLDPYRLKNAITYGGDHAVQVGITGIIQDGHHRVADAILNGRAVDVFVLPYK